MKLLLSLALVSTLAVSGQAVPAKDKVTQLPGVDFAVTFDHYSGYLKASDTRRLHYWFVEAQKDPKTAPVVLWLNGGPGCSSLLGLLSELGPFFLKNKGMDVYANPSSWNKFFNVIFLESPAGTGFSYDMHNDTATNDEQTAQQNHVALIDFFKNFLDCGTTDRANFPHFEGVAIGNGLLSNYLEDETSLGYLYNHAIVNQDQYDNVVEHCCGGDLRGCTFDLQDEQCNDAYEKCGSPGNSYNIYDNCYVDDQFSVAKFSKRTLNKKLERESELPACHYDWDTTRYLQRNDVRHALHIPEHVSAWSMCGGGSPYEETHEDVKAEYKSMIASGIRILTYNGDYDNVCNHVMNERFLKELKLKVDQRVNGKEWHYNSIIAGYWTKFEEKVDFVTVRAAGHMVPMDKPEQALQMIYNFVHQRDYSLPVPA